MGGLLFFLKIVYNKKYYKKIMQEEIKHLYKSRKNRVWAGIIGGVGEYFNVDASILRLTWIVLVFMTGFFPGLFAYIVAMLVIPQAPK